jgi:hypothetical protein
MSIMLSNNRQITVARVNVKIKRAFVIFTSILLSIEFLFAVLLRDYTYFAISFLLLSVYTLYKSRNIYRKLSEISVQGEDLIITNREKNRVTSVNSIRSIKSRKIGSAKFTSLKYRLDGIEHSAMTLTNSDESPGTLLKSFQTRKKNKKANL